MTDRENHVEGGIDTLDIKAFAEQVEERAVIAAPKFERGRTVSRDERSITIGSEMSPAEGGINLGNDSGIELCGMHVRNVGRPKTVDFLDSTRRFTWADAPL